MHQGVKSAHRLNPSGHMLHDYEEFEKGYQPIIAERAMVPR